MVNKLLLIVFLILSSCKMVNRVFIPNYNEAAIPAYVLPDPLEFENGDRITTPSDWQIRRAEIYTLFEEEVYGIAPTWKGSISSEITYENEAFNGKAIIREIKLTLHYDERELDVYLLLHLPKNQNKPAVFLGANFFGNHTTTTDTNVSLAHSWVRNNPEFSSENKAAEESRGLRTERWPAEEIISRGYGLATFYYGDIDPDFDHGFKMGVHGLMDIRHRKDSWGSVAAWAWGMSRIMDFFEAYDPVNSQQVFVLGHSRIGKAALWAGASDERFAMVISNNSGCGGAALSRRQFGETVRQINRRFPHWFAGNFKRYDRRVHRLPVDQHQLLALIAPRPLYVASAELDRWADPRGEFLSSVEATKVYKLLDKEGLPVSEMPAVNEPVHGTIGYHIRNGGHDINLYDWHQYLDFADKHFKSKKTTNP